MKKKFSFSAWLFIVIMLASVSARQPDCGLGLVKEKLAQKNYEQANILLQTWISNCLTTANKDSLSEAYLLKGKITYELFGPQKSIEGVQAMANKVLENQIEPENKLKVYLDVMEAFSSLGLYQASLNILDKAAALSLPNNLQARVAYNQGAQSLRLGKVAQSANYHRKALQIREAEKNIDPEDLYLSYNAMGSILWQFSKYDSAIIYYKGALEQVKKLPPIARNKYYRPSIVQNNIAGLYSAQGNLQDGINIMEQSIENSQQFIASPEEDSKKEDAGKSVLEGVDNLAAMYKEMGDYKRAGELLSYSYSKKLQKLPKEHPGIFISEILLAQHYNDIHQYAKCLTIVDKAIEKIEKTEGDYLFWKADAYYAQALAFENLNKINEAAESYKKAESFYEASYQGDYDNIYLQFLRNLATFYANQKQFTKAISIAQNSLAFIKKTQGAESLGYFYEVLKMAELSLLSGEDARALTYSNQALQLLNTQIKNASYFADTIKLEMHKPSAILYQQKAIYNTTEIKDSSFLKKVSDELAQALVVLKRRRSVLSDDESIALLMSENEDLLNFLKKIDLELYVQTQATGYLEKFLNIYETALFNRLRSRIDKTNQIKFSNIPSSVLEKETQLRTAITNSINKEDSSSGVLAYQQASRNWDNFLNNLKTNYPSYYNLRYGFPNLSIKNIQKDLLPNTSTVRYFKVDSSWYVLALNKVDFSFKKLDASNLEKDIEGLLFENAGNNFQGPLLFDLYKTLWQPIASIVNNNAVNIIPEGILYALSFDMLTPKLATGYKDLIKNSLLSTQPISYQYSLLWGSTSNLQEKYSGNYIAFIPEFNLAARNKYTNRIKDSLKLDYDYLNLLSQPHTLQTSLQIKDELKGVVFSNEAATLAAFKSNASGHKIIHIGTHAQYNNLHPEKSRLIFSKTENGYSDSNYLYLDDIYSCNTSSDLTILTACESGRAGYRDGEGMVSIAHAFSYSGSNRILTSLWKVDEKSTSKITEDFINLLQEEDSPAAALRQAKLNYLSQADGRTLTPAHWAGLVIMGNNTNINFLPVKNNNYPLLIGLGLVIIAGIAFLLRRNKKAPTNLAA